MLYFDSQTITLLVDEGKKVIATESGHGLSSNNHPHANSVNKHICPLCAGAGRVVQRGGGMSIGSITCPNCGGSGNIYR